MIFSIMVSNELQKFAASSVDKMQKAMENIRQNTLKRKAETEFAEQFPEEAKEIYQRNKIKKEEEARRAAISERKNKESIEAFGKKINYGLNQALSLMKDYPLMRDNPEIRKVLYEKKYGPDIEKLKEFGLGMIPGKKLLKTLLEKDEDAKKTAEAEKIMNHIPYKKGISFNKKTLRGKVFHNLTPFSYNPDEKLQYARWALSKYMID